MRQGRHVLNHAEWHGRGLQRGSTVPIFRAVPVSGGGTLTRHLKPEPITEARADRLQEAAAAVTGRSLTGVRYRFPAGSPWPRGYARDRIDEVDMAVAADFTGGATLVISWAMEGFAEGIDVEAGPGARFTLIADRESEFRAGDSGSWSGLNGKVLSELAVAWHVSSEYAPSTAWAVRLSFADGDAVFIALGQVRDEVVAYQPDGLVVFASADEAEAYRDQHETYAGGTLSPWRRAFSEPE